MKQFFFLILITACLISNAYSDQQTCFVYVPTRSKSVTIPTQNSTVTSECKLCKAVQQNNENEFPLVRTQYFTVMLNIYPYGKGHVLIVANEHVKSVDQLKPEARNELTDLMIATTTILKNVFKCPGINIGYNEGKCSGASIPDHVHVHVLPRFEHFDKTFAHAISNVQIVQWDFRELQHLLKPYFENLVANSGTIKLQD